MWMCTRCQAINDGEATGAVCPKCGATAPEPTIPPHARAMSAIAAAQESAPTAEPTAPSASVANASALAAEAPVQPTEHANSAPTAPNLAQPPLGIASGPNGRPSSILPPVNGDAPFAVDEPEEVEISEEEYKKLTAQAQLMRSPIVAIALVIVALVGIGTAVYENSMTSDQGDNILGPSTVMTELIAHRHAGALNLSGIWIGTDHSSTQSIPVSYTFQQGSQLLVTGPSDATGTGAPETAQGTYAVKGQTLTISNLTLSGTQTSAWPAAPASVSTLSYDGSSLVIKQAGGSLFLKRPQAVAGNWSGAVPLPTGSIKVKLALAPNGSETVTGRDATGKLFTLSGNYAVVSGSVIVRTQPQPALNVPFPPTALLTFDGDDLMVTPQSTDSTTPGSPIRFTKQ